MSAFGAAIDLHPDSAGFSWQVPAGWEQGRGAWGGLVIAAMVRGVVLAEPDRARSIRTVSAHLFGPTAAGSARIAVEPLRTGSAMTTWSVTVADATAETTASAVVITGRARAGDLHEAMRTWSEAVMPAVPAWEAVPVAPVRPPIGPAFAEQVEYRVVSGMPFTGSAARTLGWVRFPDQGAWDAEQLIGIADAWWPCAMPALAEARPMATVSSATHLLIAPEHLAIGEPLIAEATMAAAHDGFTTETRRLWTAQGRLAVENHQSIVVIR